MTRLPSLQVLLSFEASVRLRSFTRAAEELALTQGAVSQHVRALESRLETRLFHRKRLGVVPTEEAQHLALQVRQGLGVLERAFQLEPRKAKSSGPVQLCLSTLPSIAKRWLAPRLLGFQRQHSDIEVQVETGSGLASLDHHDGVDVALRYGPGNWPGLRCDKLADESIVPVVSPAYLSPGHADDADLTAYTLLRHPAQPWELWFQAAGLPLVESAEGPQFDDFDAYIDAAVDGRGVALARRTLVSKELESGQLVCPWQTETRDVHAYYLVWRPDSAKLAAIEALRFWLLSEFA